MTASRATSDRLRQVAVTVAEIGCILGTLVGVGVLGTRVEESSGGALAADATLLAPASPAFSIWSVIYGGLAAYTIWQWLPVNTANIRARRSGWLVALSMLLNAAWLLVTQQGWLWASVGVIAALVVTLGVLLRRLDETAPTSRAELVVVDGTMGLYLGWVAVATCANVTATLVASGVDPARPTSTFSALAVLAAAAGIGVLLATRLGGRYAVALAMAWGLGWIGVARITDQPKSATVGLAALAAALVVVAAASHRHRPRPIIAVP